MTFHEISLTAFGRAEHTARTNTEQKKNALKKPARGSARKIM